VGGEREEVLVGDQPIELRERIHAFLFLLVVGERQLVDFGFADFVVDALGDIELAGDDRALEIEARRGIFEAAQAPAADIEFGQRIVQFPFPLFAAAAGVDGDQTGGEAAVLGQERSLINVDGLHAVDGHGEAELAGGRVGDVGGVHHHGGTMLGSGGNGEGAAGIAQDARDERQGVGDVSEGRVGRSLVACGVMVTPAAEAPSSTGDAVAETSTLSEWVSVGTIVSSSEMVLSISIVRSA
jgi:hypothetical protein